MKTTSGGILRSPLIISRQVKSVLGLSRQRLVEEGRKELVPEHMENLVSLVNWKQRIREGQSKRDRLMMSNTAERRRKNYPERRNNMHRRPEC